MSICITGGSSGIGRAIAEQFALSGADVFINYHSNDDAAEDAAAAIERNGGTPHLIKVDVGTVDGARELMTKVSEKTDRLDQLVHGSAKTVPGKLTEIDPHELEAAVQLNGTALVHLAREALPLLGEGSSVFYITSRGGTRVIPGYGALGSAKALSDHLVRYLGVELASLGIRVNAISPGAVDTAAYRAMFPDTWQERLEAAAKANPTGKKLEVEDIARAVEALSKSEFSMVVGETIWIDGGAALM